jgi:NAD(P)-dependent dehydrogenase (short-subunit alcohol dehydrogenase family)
MCELELRDKMALVTGGSRHLGHAMELGLASLATGTTLAADGGMTAL